METIEKLFADFLAYAEKRVNAIDSALSKDFNLILETAKQQVMEQQYEQAFLSIAEFINQNHLVFERLGIDLAEPLIQRLGCDELWLLKLRGIQSTGYVKGSWELDDAEQIAKNYPYTFYKPSKNITTHLKVGNVVKLIFNFKSTNGEHPIGERMWVEITAIERDSFTGTLSNDPYYLSDLFWGDTIHFEHKHIIDCDLDLSEESSVDKYLPRCWVTQAILYENAPINYICRDEPLKQKDDDEYPDSGWCFYSGDETDEYMSDVENLHVVSLGAVLQIDDSFIDVLDSDVGTAFARDAEGVFQLVDYEAPEE